MSNLIFDFDGTLADTLPLVVDITGDITHARHPRPERVSGLRRVPLMQAVRSLGGRIWAIPFVMVLTRRRMRPRMDEVHSFKGIRAAIGELAGSRHRLFVLSSNSKENVQVFLQDHGLADHFEAVEHCGMFRKGAGLQSMLEKFNLGAKHTFYIGNEAADIDDVRGSGVRAIAVTWSGQDRALLDRAQPYKIVNTPKDLVAVIAKDST